jgi:RNA polymerase sigma-70 factor (ECF subfamily)
MGRAAGAPGQDEAALADALRRGDRDLLPALVDGYAARIFGFASRMCRSAEDARDVVQETFLAAVRSLKDFRGEGKVSTWLFRIAANACRKMRRRGKFEPERHLSLDDFLPQEAGHHAAEPAGTADTPEVALLRTDLREALEAAIADLPPPYRAVLILRDVEGLSTEETAEALGLTPPTVKTRLHRARLFLRQRLVEHT